MHGLHSSLARNGCRGIALSCLLASSIPSIAQDGDHPLHPNPHSIARSTASPPGNPFAFDAAPRPAATKAPSVVPARDGSIRDPVLGGGPVVDDSLRVQKARVVPAATADEPVFVKPGETLDWRVNGGLPRQKTGIALPILDDGLERPVATVRYRGTIAHFAESELLLTGKDERELRTLAATVDGKVTRRYKLGLSAKGDPTHAWLVTVRPPAKASHELVGQLGSREGTVARGLYEFSSRTAMDTAATALLQIERLQRTGASSGRAGVGLNWIMPPTTLENELLIEGVNADEDGFLNAFRFPYLASGSAQDTQVNHAWQLLKMAGALDGNDRAVDARRVRVAVMDGGFHSGVDLLDPEINGASFDEPNPALCSGGFPCAWHGSGVAEAMAATLGNARATAGPAGPVADVTLQTAGGYDIASLFAYVTGLADTLEVAPRVLNMSFGTRVPGLLAVTTGPIDIAISTLMAADVLTVAAAGNDGLSVDERICANFSFGLLCRELDRSIPCEVAHVLCVGALGSGTVTRASFSAFGDAVFREGSDLQTVDIFAQGVGVFVGPDPDAPGGPNSVGQQISGTSIATPLVAGTAALVVAADPEATAFTVSRRLVELASTNALDLPAGATADGDVPRWVNAARPVRRALLDANTDTDFPPALTFVTPTKLFPWTTPVVAMDTPVTLRVNALDVEDGVDCCEISWRVNGVLLPGRDTSIITHTFTATGNHELEVSMTDSGGQTAVASLRVRARP